MYSATFIFAKGDFDDEFHRIDQEIAEMARSAPGYLGEEAWENPSTGLVSNVYYWESSKRCKPSSSIPGILKRKPGKAGGLPVTRS